MSIIAAEELKRRYSRYSRRVKEIMKLEKETEKRAIAKASLEFNVTPRTIENALKNRPGKGKKQIISGLCQ